MKRMFAFIFVVLCFEFCPIYTLDQWDQSISDQFLQRKQLSPTVLGYLCGNTYWRSAVSTYVDSDKLVKFQYGPPVNNACNMSVTMYDPNGSVLLEEMLVDAEVLEDKYLGYYISSQMVGYYTFNCSLNLVALYRGQMSWEYRGPKFMVLSPWDMKESEISAERDSCKQEITKIDNLAGMVDNQYPDFTVTT